MLMSDLGYRPPSAAELAGTLLRYAAGKYRVRRDKSRPFNLPAAVLHIDPLISYSGIVPFARLGMASLIPPFFRQRDAWLLLSPTWSIENDIHVRTARRYAVLYRMVNPGHKLIFMCNAEDEVALLHRCGEAAMFHNKTSNVVEEIFRPLDNVRIEFDAVYNAQLAKWKRHELTLDIERCAFLFYRGISSTTESERALIARHAERAPGHVFINATNEKGLPVRLEPRDVNLHLNRAAVGLCLSETEGAMFASTEYLLAGLPVVTTPSRGGRDVYFDKEFCLTVPADPRSVAEAVTALKARNIPRQHIRERTLARLTADRRRFIDLVNAMLAASGREKRFAIDWRPSRPVIMNWMDPDRAFAALRAGTVDDIGLIAEKPSQPLRPRRVAT